MHDSSEVQMHDEGGCADCGNLILVAGIQSIAIVDISSQYNCCNCICMEGAMFLVVHTKLQYL